VYRSSAGESYQAVQLVGHRRGEDGLALNPLNRVGEIVVLGWILNPLEAHANYRNVSDILEAKTE
jgi:hypothetical protein